MNSIYRLFKLWDWKDQSKYKINSLFFAEASLFLAAELFSFLEKNFFAHSYVLLVGVRVKIPAANLTRF